MMKKTYRVEGMTCDGCVRTVTKVLTQALPSATVEVTLDGGLVLVRGEHDEDALREAVEDAGFDYAGTA